MKIFLAATEDLETASNMDKLKIENIFMSYYYMRKKDGAKSMLLNRPHVSTIIVDSGAHTFFSENSSQGLTASVHTKKTKTAETPDEYFEAYLIWLKKYYDVYDYYVELDIGELIGQEKVINWRKRLKQLGLFKKCITVVHPATCNFEEFKQLLKDSESKYVAIEGLRPGSPQIPYGKYTLEAYRNGVKLHGFALTNKKIIGKYPFYSADSSSWKAGVQYGIYSRSVNGNSKAISFKQNKWGHDMAQPDLIKVYSTNLKEQRLARLSLTVKSYKDMQDYLTKLWKAKGIDFKDFQVNKGGKV